jgi:hypothetical protein
LASSYSLNKIIFFLSFFVGFAQPQNNSAPKKVEIEAPQESSSQDKEEEEGERSSGSGESTPMMVKMRKGGDPYRAYNDLRSDSIVSTTSTINDDEEKEERESGGGGRRCVSFRQVTLHLDPSSSSRFRAGQPKYQSAILPSSRKNASRNVPPLKQGDNNNSSEDNHDTQQVR